MLYEKRPHLEGVSNQRRTYMAATILVVGSAAFFFPPDAKSQQNVYEYSMPSSDDVDATCFQICRKSQHAQYYTMMLRERKVIPLSSLNRQRRICEDFCLEDSSLRISSDAPSLAERTQRIRQKFEWNVFDLLSTEDRVGRNVTCIPADARCRDPERCGPSIPCPTD